MLDLLSEDEAADFAPDSAPALVSVEDLVSAATVEEEDERLSLR